MKKPKYHVFDVNPEDNSGESVSITTEFLNNGDTKDNIYLQQTIIMQSYGNSASFNLSSAPLTPKKLRKWADELDNEIKKMKGNIAD